MQLIMQYPSIAANIGDTEQFTVVIPPAIHVEGIGKSALNQTHGIPIDKTAEFGLLVNSSSDGRYWELTTTQPIGVSISYNTRGSIMAVFVSMRRSTDNFQIPSDQISIYPSKVIFDIGPQGGGDSNRIFHFNPIIRIEKNTPPGNYVGTIRFTIVGQ